MRRELESAIARAKAGEAVSVVAPRGRVEAITCHVLDALDVLGERAELHLLGIPVHTATLEIAGGRITSAERAAGGRGDGG